MTKLSLVNQTVDISSGIPLVPSHRETKRTPHAAFCSFSPFFETPNQPFPETFRKEEKAAVLHVSLSTHTHTQCEMRRLCTGQMFWLSLFSSALNAFHNEGTILMGLVLYCHCGRITGNCKSPAWLLVKKEKQWWKIRVRKFLTDVTEIHISSWSNDQHKRVLSIRVFLFFANSSRSLALTNWNLKSRSFCFQHSSNDWSQLYNLQEIIQVISFLRLLCHFYSSLTSLTSVRIRTKKTLRKGQVSYFSATECDFVQQHTSHCCEITSTEQKKSLFCWVMSEWKDMLPATTVTPNIVTSLYQQQKNRQVPNVWTRISLWRWTKNTKSITRQVEQKKSHDVQPNMVNFLFVGAGPTQPRRILRKPTTHVPFGCRIQHVIPQNGTHSLCPWVTWNARAKCLQNPEKHESLSLIVFNTVRVFWQNLNFCRVVKHAWETPKRWFMPLPVKGRLLSLEFFTVTNLIITSHESIICLSARWPKNILTVALETDRKIEVPCQRAGKQGHSKQTNFPCYSAWERNQKT